MGLEQAEHHYGNTWHPATEVRVTVGLGWEEGEVQKAPLREIVCALGDQIGYGRFLEAALSKL